MKRALDAAASAVGLALLSPVLGAIAAWVALDSPGPVLFRQSRVGQGGRDFQILKFRTMHVNAERMGPGITIGADPRVTRAGRVLRALKLDELPQLINVLRGDMSLVGPRPELRRYVDLYPPEARAALARVRPGITSLASVAYRNESDILARAADPESAYVNEVMPAKLRWDLEYVARASIALDLRIIARTLAAIVRH